jgi:hypothetical protein
MKSNLALLTINKIIIHEVPKHSKGSAGVGPIYSEVESPFDQNLELFFLNKMISSLKSHKSFDICVDVGCSSPVPGLLARHFDSVGGEFVEITKRIAQHLYNIQDGTNPGGLLAILDCAVNEQKALGVIKLEKEEGVRLQQTLHENLRTFDLNVLRDLVLTERTKIYKVALFVMPDEVEETYDAAASDYQTGFSSYHEVASFFLSKFLGCKLQKDPPLATKHFYEVTEEFINEQIADPVERIKYHEHLVSEIQSQTPTISTEQFADNYLPVEERQKFVNHLTEKDVPANFPKKLDLVSKRLKKTVYHFRSGIQVIVPNEVAEGHLVIENLDEGETRLEIKDQLEGVKGK